MKTFCAGLIFVLAAITLPSIDSKAAESLEITGAPVRVYRKPDLLSPVAAVLNKGSKIVAASNPVGTFKKVLYYDKAGKKTFGYVALGDLTTNSHALATNAPIMAKASGGSHNRGLHNVWAAGLKLGLNYQYQGARTYTDGQGNSASVSSLTGANFSFEAFVDVPMSPTFTIEGYLQYKPTTGTGTGTPNVGGATQPLNIILLETFISLGGLARVYPNQVTGWWWGGGAQIDHGSSGSLQFGSNAATTLKGSDLPNFFFVYGATGLDFPMGRSFVLQPDLRLGAIFNTSPPIIEVDALVGGAYKF